MHILESLTLINSVESNKGSISKRGNCSIAFVSAYLSFLVWEVCESSLTVEVNSSSLSHKTLDVIVKFNQ